MFTLNCVFKLVANIFCPFLTIRAYFAFLAKFEVSHSALLDVWINENRNEKALFDWIVDKFHLNDVSVDLKAEITKKIRSFHLYILKNLPKCNRTITTFKRKHSSWLLSSMTVVVEKINDQVASENQMGRPRLSYSDAGSRLKRKMAKELADNEENNTSLLVHAASVSAKKAKMSDTAFVLKNTLSTSSSSSEIRKKLSFSEPVPLTPSQALAFLIDNSVTKAQYNSMRALNKSQFSNIYPCYNKVREAKLECRPTGVNVTETRAEVSLQNLLNHTASRIFLLQDDVFKKHQNIADVKLIASYGFDGSTGQSMYKQRFLGERSDINDDSLFVTSVIPLKLTDDFGTPLWINQSPQSVRFCRPLKLEFAKETKDLILAEKADLESQIQNLTAFNYNFSIDRKITVTFDLHLTLIDGKVLNILTGTKSCQVCPICGASPKDFMKTTDISNFKAKSGNLQHGISPLHAWIRFFEFVLKISYKLHLKKWQVRDKEEKDMITSRKQEIQKLFWSEMGLHVDKPKQNGSGNTNDGNTARRAFKNTRQLSVILELDYDILQRFYIILITISCEFPVNTTKFSQLCQETASNYMEKYSWYPMSATVHKVLVHGSQIIASSVLPIGCFGENASEARNKLYKRDRQSYARRNSRINNLSDVFHRSMDSSDPFLSSLNIKKRLAQNKKTSLPKEVIELLEAPNVEYNNQEQFLDSDDSNSDTDHEDNFCLDLEVEKED